MDQSGAMVLDEAALLARMPQQPPFLFLNQALVGGKQASAQYRITGNESFLTGHFKGNPVFPASISIEALGQLAVLLLLTGQHPELQKPVNPASIYFSSCDGVRCTRICRPGDLLEIQVRLLRLRHPVATFEGSIQVDGTKASRVEALSLVFDFAAS
jgi:3-hydroxyacyl-[acyl-carrier-protein] dehydratase